MSVTIISEPEKWLHKTIGNCYHEYNKIFTVQGTSADEIAEWAAKYSQLPHMKSRGNCGDTAWTIQPVGALFAVRFTYLVDSSD